MPLVEGQKSPRILVMGLGGIGGVVSAYLFEQGYDVTAVTTNKPILQTINKVGLCLAGDGDERIVEGRALSEPPLGGSGYDFVLLATQPPQVEAAAKSAMGALKDDGVMVCFQNGLCEERIARLVGRERVIGAIVAWGASMAGPGQYIRTSAGGFTIGRFGEGPDERCDDLATLLECIGPVQVTDNLRGARWSKLAINCAISTLGTVGGDRLGRLLAHRFVRRLALEVMTEVVEIAQLENVQLVPVAGTVNLEKIALSSAERRSVGSPSLLKKHALLLAVGARYRRLRSSMLSAIERGRTPAIDYLNGEVVSAADRHGRRVPINETLQRIVHSIATGDLRPGLEHLKRVYDETRPAN